MKPLRLAFLAASVLHGLALASASAQERPRLSLDEVATRVSEQDFTVFENATRVYQAKESLQLARRNLLPRLNLWKAIEVVVEPRAIVGMVEDIAPFLVPDNWFRVKEEKEFLAAQQEAYHALWANQILTAKSLFTHALLDEALLLRVRALAQELDSILVLARNREMMGGIAPGLSLQIETELLTLAEDERALAIVIQEDKTQLGWMTGLGGTAEAELIAPAIDHLDTLRESRFEDLEKTVLERSPELKQCDALIRAARTIKKARTFSFLGASSLSRGVAGGIFDDLPVSEGLGFGIGPSIRIAKSQVKILEIQRQGVVETLRRTTLLAVSNYNSDLKALANARQRLALSRAVLESLRDRLSLGADIGVEELILATRNTLRAETDFAAAQVRLLGARDKLDRLKFTADYGPRPSPESVR